MNCGNFGFLLLWYAFVWALILLFKWFFRATNMPKFRDSHGDITHEAGYFEDPTGRSLCEDLDSADSSQSAVIPHINAHAHLGSGPM